MTARDDIDDLAGEYVLGTLDAGERALVAARRQREPDLDAAIRDWERRLAPLDAATKSVAPPADLCARVVRRMFPWTPADAEPYAAFLWATGRGELAGQEPVGEGWIWLSAPLSEWSGSQLSWSPPG